ncbi:RNA dependent RNA polymerase-domain-containing protein [Chlamydoabsidia padenii]|nr:RNA dependent RNA polymerase-domain-containing protein [Chlamydoabsidia padenii]
MSKPSTFSSKNANVLWQSINVAKGEQNGGDASNGAYRHGHKPSSSGGRQNSFNNNNNSNNNNNRNNNNNNNGPASKRENKVIVVSNLNPLTKSETIYDVFIKYGHVFNVELNNHRNDRFDGTANVEFFSMPKDFDIDRRITIDGRKIGMSYGKTLSEEQRPTHCNAKSLSLGIMITPTQFVEEWTTESEVKLSVYYDNRRMRTEFRHFDTTYSMEMKFTDITSDLVVENIGNATYLTIPLKEPARFSFYDINALDDSDKSTKSTKVPLSRANMIPLNPPPHYHDSPTTGDSSSSVSSISSGQRSPQPPSTTAPTGNTPHAKGSVMVCTDKNYLRLETWTVYRIKIDPLPQNRHYVLKLLNGMADYNLVPRKHQLLKQQLTVTPASQLPVPKSHQERTQLLDFEVLYLLECCITQNYIMERNLDDGFYKLLLKLGPGVSCALLNMIAQEKKRVWNPTRELESIWNKHKEKVFHQRRIPNHCSMLRKVIITPTSMYIQPPSLETTNRVIRHFDAYSDRFVRIQFTDEGLTRITAGHKRKTQEAIFDRVYQTLKRGILIGNRRYDYLGFSGSQLREHGCWFFASDDGSSGLPPMNADGIRAWMGDFSDIKIVAKHAARIGQCFSSTTAILKLEKSQVEQIDDIVHNSYTFSDGVGNISQELLNEVARRMSLRTVPSAFQFRLGGAKGVLMVSNKLHGRKIQLRPSQVKFNSDHYMLEVVRISTHISATLNRQAITLLSALGVKDEVFMERLKNVLFGLNRMLAHSEEAIKILNSNADEFGTTRLMANIISGGFLDKQDPFIKNLLNIFRVTMLKSLKEKAKIPVDKGAFLLGVVDETGALDANEVFCQVSSEQSQKKCQVIKGKCMVFRNPCFHPGDIRVVTAVDSPKLHHLKNVLVFSGVGYRDIPSMCSGGDLDGDDYT